MRPRWLFGSAVLSRCGARRRSSLTPTGGGCSTLLLPGLGTPGSGDVFIGALAGLLASGMAPVGALGWAVRLHAAAGALLANATPVGYLASDIAARLPEALCRAMAE